MSWIDKSLSDEDAITVIKIILENISSYEYDSSTRWFLVRKYAEIIQDPFYDWILESISIDDNSFTTHRRTTRSGSVWSLFSDDHSTPLCYNECVQKEIDKIKFDLF